MNLASASCDKVALRGRTDRAVPDARRGIRVVEAALAAGAFAALCVVVLSVAAQSAEPDDGAYRASIVAMTEGHFLTLSTAQAETLASKLGDNPAAPPNQWVELSDGRYISEKDPGYPFLAAPFQALGIIRHDAGVALRATFIVDPQGDIRWVNVNDLSVGRSVDETLRVLDALQTDELCPCNWKAGQETIKVA